MRLFLIILLLFFFLFIFRNQKYFCGCHYSAIVICGCCRNHIIIQQHERKKKRKHNTISCVKKGHHCHVCCFVSNIFNCRMNCCERESIDGHAIHTEICQFFFFTIFLCVLQSHHITCATNSNCDWDRKKNDGGAKRASFAHCSHEETIVEQASSESDVWSGGHGSV